jgi:hypothetical protein
MPFWQKQRKAYISMQAVGSEKKLQTQFVLFAGLLLSSSAALDYHYQHNDLSLFKRIFLEFPYRQQNFPLRGRM